MAEYRTGSQSRRRQNYSRRDFTYIEGNTVRVPERVWEDEIRITKPPKRQRSNAARKNREKAHRMSFGYVLFLAGAMIMAGIILTGYIGLQSDITESIRSISKLESQLNNLKLENDEEYSRITSSVDLEEVKRIAIQELGMKYAEEGQIITFSGEGSDYVRQVADIPQ